MVNQFVNGLAARFPALAASAKRLSDRGITANEKTASSGEEGADEEGAGEEDVSGGASSVPAQEFDDALGSLSKLMEGVALGVIPSTFPVVTKRHLRFSFITSRHFLIKFVWFDFGDCLAAVKSAKTKRAVMKKVHNVAVSRACRDFGEKSESRTFDP